MVLRVQTVRRFKWESLLSTLAVGCGEGKTAEMAPVSWVPALAMLLSRGFGRLFPLPSAGGRVAHARPRVQYWAALKHEMQ